jgi:CubicO group peptidase (beta-lactamase class C family)
MTRRQFGEIALAVGAQSSRLFAANGIDEVLRRGQEQRKIPAVVAMTGTADSVTYAGAFGTRDAESGTAVGMDSMFAIASMTKAVTSTAAMQLVERGKMTLDEPASKHLPELGMLQVLEGFDGAGKPLLRPARTRVTLRHLLTHTSGFAYDVWHEAMFKFTSAGGDATHVLAFEPGSNWQYGPSTFWAGRLVETVSGMDLEAYMQQNILGPLGMKDTTFAFPQAKFDRLVQRYQHQPDGSMTPAERTLPPRPPVYRGDGGLFSTAPDYIKFTQMILKKGAGPKGERILQVKTVAQMSTNGTGKIAAGRLKTQIPARSSDVDFHVGHDDRSTLGFLMNPDAVPGARAAGSLGWAGINNTYYWIDPHRSICGVIMMQFLPFADKDAVALLSDFEHAAYSARA